MQKSVMNKCELCKSSRQDVLLFGEFLTKCGISVHSYCLYLTSNLYQRGTEDEGVFGFMPEDIRAEARRISQLNCYYCGKNYASIGCCQKKCRITFHVACGMQHGAENEFVGTFQSYCHRHVRKASSRPQPNEMCCICYEALQQKGEQFNVVAMLQAPCCHNGWFHKLCLQQFANSAGYFFKCPLCNNNANFRDNLLRRGIFIPDVDASWELEPNAYAELLERPDKCCSAACKGGAISTKNPLVVCVTCGSLAMHKRCLANGGDTFNCSDCVLVSTAGASGEDNASLRNYSHAAHGGQQAEELVDNDDDSDMDDGDVDVCNVSVISKVSTGAGDASDCADEEENDIITVAVSRKRTRCIYDEEADEQEDNIEVLTVSSAGRCDSRLGHANINATDEETDEEVAISRTKRMKKSTHRRLADSSPNDDDEEEDYAQGRCRLRRKRHVIESSGDERQATLRFTANITDNGHRSLVHDSTAGDTTDGSSRVCCVKRRTRRKNPFEQRQLRGQVLRRSMRYAAEHDRSCNDEQENQLVSGESNIAYRTRRRATRQSILLNLMNDTDKESIDGSQRITEQHRKLSHSPASSQRSSSCSSTFGRALPRSHPMFRDLESDDYGAGSSSANVDKNCNVKNMEKWDAHPGSGRFDSRHRNYAPFMMARMRRVNGKLKRGETFVPAGICSQ